ncbi:hypothetical protein Clacol_003525 [Clathrus columnatus]|uniref:Mitochondrial import inner membrane translocase subunit TIM22 n=1 Tax=Clathrus columnatus TaxID=1419009 RepID=A0AAV5A761_9AGAM|nr:hypothetical protein Clacol_003525 [Clathrus columnatus]
MPFQFSAPFLRPDQEPLPPGWTPDDRTAFLQQQKWARIGAEAIHSCPAKAVMASGMGFGLGAFISLMSASFAYEDPLLRSQIGVGSRTTTQKTMEMFKDMGRGMYRSGRGFAKVAGLFSGIECVIESYRAKNDMVNGTSAGFVAGSILAYSQGPRAAIGGGIAFALFSLGIEMFLRREPSDDD